MIFLFEKVQNHQCCLQPPTFSRTKRYQLKIASFGSSNCDFLDNVTHEGIKQSFVFVGFVLIRVSKANQYLDEKRL